MGLASCASKGRVGSALKASTRSKVIAVGTRKTSGERGSDEPSQGLLQGDPAGGSHHQGSLEGPRCDHSEEAETEVCGRAERVVELDSSLGACGEVGSCL